MGSPGETNWLKAIAKRLVRKISAGIGSVRGGLGHLLRAAKSPGTISFWEARYRSGGDSGLGSFGRLAQFKADVLNDFVRQAGIASIIEFGCGDGNQLRLAAYPSYVGLDVSRE